MINEHLLHLYNNAFVRILMIWIVLDTILGCMRAIKQHKFNSAFGIDGGIRKVAMLVSIAFLMLADHFFGINVISWLPEATKTALQLEKIGIGEFFSVLFILYESISILKNLYLCGCPVPRWLGEWIEKFLENLTGELDEVKK